MFLIKTSKYDYFCVKSTSDHINPSNLHPDATKVNVSRGKKKKETREKEKNCILQYFNLHRAYPDLPHWVKYHLTPSSPVQPPPVLPRPASAPAAALLKLEFLHAALSVNN